jgi:hypothetical protein
MTESVGDDGFSGLTADECDRLIVENNSKILELEADLAAAGGSPQTPVVLELLKRESALLSVLRNLLLQKLDDNARADLGDSHGPSTVANFPKGRA